MTPLDRRSFCAGLGATMSLGTSTAEAGDINVAFDTKLAGVPVRLPASASLSNGAVPATVSIELRIALNDLIGKLDLIVEAAGLRHPPGHYQSFDYRGTIAAVAGDRLWLKYHFRIDPRGAPATNGSVEIWLGPVVAPDDLRLAASGVRLNISNTIARTVVRAMGLQRRLESGLLDAVNGALGSPEARLQIPPELAGPQTRILGARFAKDGGSDLLIIAGEARLTPELLANLYRRIGRTP